MITLGKKCSLEPTDKHSEQDNGYLSTRRGKPAIALKQHRRNGAQRWPASVQSHSEQKGTARTRTQPPATPGLSLSVYVSFTNQYPFFPHLIGQDSLIPANGNQ